MKYVSKIFLTVDVVAIKRIENVGFLALIKRKNEPFKDCWALPGGFVDENEDLMDAAAREFREETSINSTKFKQIGAYGKPFRDPRSHVVSVAYLTIVDSTVVGEAADDAKELRWFAFDNLPELAFDHQTIIEDALRLVE